METRTHSGRRILKIAAITVLAAALIIAIAFFALFHNELATLNSIERIDGTTLFTMDFQGDYGFDEFLSTGASNDTELIGFITRQLLKGIPMEFDLPDLGCSTFAAGLSDGTPIFGRNFDMYYSPALLVTTRPENGYDSISMVNLAYIGFGEDRLPTSLASSLMTLAAPYVPLDGVNEKGLAVGVLLIDTEPTDQQTDKVDITTTTAIRLLLDRAATVDEALELLAQYDMHSSANSCYHFHIADAQGGSVIVEYIGDEMSVVEGRAATNFLLTPGDYDFGSGQDRYQTLADTLDANGGIFADTGEAMELLAAVRQTPRPDKDSVTQWSCIYDLENIALEVCMSMDYDSVYRFSLG